MSGDLKKSSRLRRLIGWIAVAVSIALASKWAFWGILENFHEGWYHHDLGKNLAMLFGQYLFATILIIAAALIALRWRWATARLDRRRGEERSSAALRATTLQLVANRCWAQSN